MPSLPYSSLFGGMAMAVLPVALVIYFFLVWDARRPDSAAAADTQIGLKTVGAALTLVGVAMFATGLQSLLLLLLTFDDFGDRIKALLPDLLVGGGTMVVAAFVLVPRTNAQQFPKSKRLTAGALALVGGTAAVAMLSRFLQVVLQWPSWDAVAAELTQFVVAAIVFGIGMIALGKLSGLEMVSAAQPQPHAQGMGHPGYPAQQQAQQGYPAQPGYPPQQQQPQQPPGYPQQPPYPPQGQQ